MKHITSNKVKNYLIDMYSQCNYNPKALALAVNEICYELDYTDAMDLFKLLIKDTPIPELHTHNYDFQTATGKHIIETIKDYYNEYKSNN